MPATRPNPDDDRLPWLRPEPVPPAAPAPPPARRRFPWPALASLAILGLLVGLFWLGRQTSRTPPARPAARTIRVEAAPNVPEPTAVPDEGRTPADSSSPAEVTLPAPAPAPAAPVAPPVIAIAPPPAAPPLAASPLASPRPAPAVHRAVKRGLHRRTPPRARQVTAAPPAAPPQAAVTPPAAPPKAAAAPLAAAPMAAAAPEPKRSPVAQATPRVVRRTTARRRYGYWPNLPTATSLKRVIQIGAYSERRSTDYAWRWAKYRYPQLRGLPKVVEPYRASDGKLYYRLQIMTVAPAQSKWLCRRMRTDRRSCIVIR